MEIKILKGVELQGYKYLSGNYVIKLERSKSKYESIDLVNYKVFNLETTESFDILPAIEKYDIGGVVNATLKQGYIYFTSIETKSEGSFISILSYNVDTGEMDCIYTFKEDINKINVSCKYKVFVLNDYVMIIQKESLKFNKTRTYSGFFDFSQTLINIKDKIVYELEDENLKKNGISQALAISENQCVLKTGFSLLEDNRYNVLEEDECSVESIGFINTSMLISDLAIEHVNIAIENIEQTCYKKTIPYVRFEDEYIIYSLVNNETKEEIVNFYNVQTEELKQCINTDVIFGKDLANVLVLNNEPYVYFEKHNQNYFLNLSQNKITKKFDKNYKIENIFHDSIILSGTTKKLFTSKEVNSFDIYNFESKKDIYREKNKYINSFETDDETIYIISD